MIKRLSVLVNISLLTTVFLLNGCSVKTDTDDKNQSLLITKDNLETEVQTDLLALTLLEADYTWLALNDKDTVRKVLEYTFRGDITSRRVNCVYDNINREQYKTDITEVARYLVENYSADVNSYIYKLRQIKPAIAKIFNHPTPVTFDTNNILNSSALRILDKSQAVMLTETMKNKKYRPLLAIVGLPAIDDNGVIEDLSRLQIESMMKTVIAAKPSCDSI